MARYRNIYIDAGDTFLIRFNIYDDDGNLFANTSGFIGSGGLKTYFDSVGYTPFTTEISGSTLTLTLSAEDTEALKGGTYIFDAFISSASQTIKVIEGKAFVTDNVTQFV